MDLASCDGCGRELPTDDLTPSANERYYCPGCAARRADDPEIEFRGRRLMLSEARLQAVDEPDLADKIAQRDGA